MGFEQGANMGTLHDAAEVVVVPAPIAGRQRLIKDGIIYNPDTASVTITLTKHSGARRARRKITIAAGASWILDRLMIIDGEDEWVGAILDSAPANERPEFDFGWGEET